MSTPHAAAAARARAFYESLTPAALDRLGSVYADDARFRDPFNDVRGLAEIRRVFERMYASLDDVRFTVIDAVSGEDGAFLTWDMSYRVRRWRPHRTQRIHGATHLRFDADGRIAYHRDYWDAAGELYETLPAIGALMRWLRRRIG